METCFVDSVPLTDISISSWGFPDGASGKELANAGDVRDGGFDPWVRKIPWRREWQPTPGFYAGEFRGQRSLVGYSPWCCTE